MELCNYKCCTVLTVTSKKVEKWKNWARKPSLNEKVKNMMAKVEFPFGSLKTMFESLGKPWFESIEQQEYAIQYAVGVYNYDVTVIFSWEK